MQKGGWHDYILSVTISTAAITSSSCFFSSHFYYFAIGAASASLRLSHLLMLLLEDGQVLVQFFNLNFQVGLLKGQVIKNLAQALEISFHSDAHPPLSLKPGIELRCRRKSPSTAVMEVMTQHEIGQLLHFITTPFTCL